MSYAPTHGQQAKHRRNVKSRLMYDAVSLHPLAQEYWMEFIQVVMLFMVGGLGSLTDVSMGDDVACLKAFKASVTDLNGYLVNWEFQNLSSGGVCGFGGVQCWNGEENRVLALSLEGLGLSGPFPSGLGSCTSLLRLNLSNNAFYGSIPSNICQQMQYLTGLDLSQNKFSDDLPENLADCAYLNELHLQQNHFTGPIPGGIGVLSKLTDLDMSSNSLSGQIPSSFTNRTEPWQPAFSADSFANNPGLCGPPLTALCADHSSSSSSQLPVIIGAVISSVLSFSLVILAIMWCDSYQRRRKAVRIHETSTNGIVAV